MRVLSEKIDGKDLLTKLMAKRGYTKKELAEYFGISTRTMRHWISVGDVSWEGAKKMAEYDGYSLDYLVFFKGSKMIEVSANPLAHNLALAIGDSSPEIYELIESVAGSLIANGSNRPKASKLELETKKVIIEFLQNHYEENYMTPGNAADKLNMRFEAMEWIQNANSKHFSLGNLFALLEQIGAIATINIRMKTYSDR